MLALAPGLYLSSGPATPAAAATRPATDLPSCDPTDPYSYDVYDSFVDFDLLDAPGYLGPTGAEACGVYTLENTAYVMYADSHDMSVGDPRIASDGRQQIAGYFWAVLEGIAYAEAHGTGSDLAAPAQGAYQWFQQLLQIYNENAAQDALNEYNKWSDGPCAYSPPNTTLFSYSAKEDDYCLGNLGELLAGPEPPSTDQFTAFGAYDAQQALGISLPDLPPATAMNVSEAIEDGAATATAILGGVGTSLAKAVFPSFAQDFGRNVFVCRVLECNESPFEKDEVEEIEEADEGQDDVQRVTDAQELVDQEESEGSEEETPNSDIEAAAEGEPVSEPPGGSGSLASDTAITDDLVPLADTAGMDVAETVETATAVGDFSSMVGIVAVAATVLVSEAIDIANQQQIPVQLQDQLNTAEKPPDVWAAMSATGGASELPFLLYESQLETRAVTPPTTLTAPPFTGDGIEVSVPPAGAGDVGSSQIVRTTQILTWPIGLAAGGDTYLAGSTTIAFSDGVIYRQPTPDEQLAGVTGWLPTGELYFFNWAHAEQVALVDGDQFIITPSTGSTDLGGADITAGCLQVGACSIVKSIEALNQYGLPVVLTLEPDTGVTAGIDVTNQYGNTPSTAQSGPNDGLIAGQTVTFSDPETSPVGSAATYTWQIETRCPLNPSEPVRVVEGVPVCAGDPAYDSFDLPPDESDLSNGTTEDPDFHGDPVETVTGQSVNFTWPAPGIYHVRLITSDAWGGPTHEADENITVAGTDPTVSFSASPGWAGDGIIGPVPDDSATSLTGCILSPSAPYGTPSVAVNWGDGTIDSASADGTGSSQISFHFGTTAGCDSPWSFTATHTYSLGYEPVTVQEPIVVTTADGLGDVTTSDLYANISFDSAPSFTSPDTAVFTTGTLGSFTATASGGPPPAITESGALPEGIGFSDGTFSGSAHLGDGGSYPITLTATSSTGTATQAFTLVVDDAPSFAGGNSVTMVVGEPSTVPITVDGYPDAWSSIVGNLPAGISEYTGNGLELFGTPAAGSTGSYPLTVTSENSAGTATETFTVNVVAGPQITSPSTANLTTGSFSSFLISATGSPSPSLSISGSLPSGLYFDDYGNGTGVIYGTAASSGSATVTVSATNAGGTATQTLRVNTSTTGGPAFSGTSSASFEVGTASSFTISSSDPNAQITCSECSNNLPAGLTFEGGSGTATISGTPASGTAGIYAPLVLATDGGTSYEFLTITVYSTPVFTGASSASVLAGTPATLTVTTNAEPLATDLYVVGSLPPGLTFTNNDDGTATISGTPSLGTSGTYSFQIDAVNLLDYETTPATETYTITVDQSPAVTSPSTAVFAEGSAGSFTVDTTGYPTATITESGTLPPGLSFVDNQNGSATLSGTPTDTVATSYPLTITATSASGTATSNLLVEVGPLPVVTSPDGATFTVGTETSFTVTTSSTPDTSVTTTDALPAGLALTDNGDGTATISGTPLPGAGGTYAVTLTVTNPYGSTTQVLAIEVGEAPGYTGATSATLQANAGLVSWTLTSSGYPLASFALAGSLPPGLSLTDNGDGTATIEGSLPSGTSGDYPLALTLTNSNGSTSVSLDLQVDESPVIIDNGPYVFPAGASGSITLSTVASPTPSFQYFGEPSWLTVTDNGDGTVTISGTPPASAEGTVANVALFAENGVGNGGIDFVQITVPALSISGTPPGGSVGTDYDVALTASEPGSLPIKFELAPHSALPPGLTLGPHGLISGVPTTVGTTTFTVEATAGGNTAESTYTVTIAPTPHELAISQFRLVGPNGAADWYADITNTTSADLSLTGFFLGVTVVGDPNPVRLPLGSGNLPPGEAVLVTGPDSSLPGGLTPVAVGPGGALMPGGMEVVTSSGDVIDQAGEVGAPPAVVEGTGIADPTYTEANLGDAFVRDSTGGVLQESGDNAADFTFEAATPTAYRPAGELALSPGTGLLAGSTVSVSGTGWNDTAVTLYECATNHFVAASCELGSAVSPTMVSEPAALGGPEAFASTSLTLAVGEVGTSGQTCGLASSASCYVVGVGSSGDEAVSSPIGFSPPKVMVSKAAVAAKGDAVGVRVRYFPLGDPLVVLECDSSVTVPAGIADHCDAATARDGTGGGAVGVRFASNLKVVTGSAFSDVAGGAVEPGGSAVIVVEDLAAPALDSVATVAINLPVSPARTAARRLPALAPTVRRGR